MNALLRKRGKRREALGGDGGPAAEERIEREKERRERVRRKQPRSLLWARERAARPVRGPRPRGGEGGDVAVSFLLLLSPPLPLVDMPRSLGCDRLGVGGEGGEER